MADDTYDASSDARDGTIELVSAYASNSNNRLTPEEFQTLIRETFATLSSLTAGSAAPVEEVEDLTKSRAEVKKSIGPDKLISFLDGKSYSSLRRHLTTNGHTPESYRTTFGLPADYPMTHPTYSARRSELAKSLGLGLKGRQARSATAAPAATKGAKPKAAPKSRKAKQEPAPAE